MPKTAKKRTRQRPRRYAPKYTNDLRNQVKLYISGWEKKRRTLAKPKYKKPREITAQTLIPNSNNISALGLYLRNKDLIDRTHIQPLVIPSTTIKESVIEKEKDKPVVIKDVEKKTEETTVQTSPVKIDLSHYRLHEGRIKKPFLQERARQMGLDDKGTRDILVRRIAEASNLFNATDLKQFEEQLYRDFRQKPQVPLPFFGHRLVEQLPQLTPEQKREGKRLFEEGDGNITKQQATDLILRDLESEGDSQGSGKYTTTSKYKSIQPLYDSQISSIMEPYRKKGFVGVFASDEIDQIKQAVNDADEIAFIMNLDKASQPGSHWVGIVIDFINNKHVCYSDSFGEDPSDDFLYRIKKIVQARKDLKYYLKMKINMVKSQRANSSTCGFLAMQFCMDMLDGKSFKEATHFNELKDDSAITESEKFVRKRFGYLLA